VTSSATLSLPLGQAAPPTRAQAEGWAVLDAHAQWPRFGRPLAQRPDCWESYLSIEGMHCAACTLAVEQALVQVPGVESVQVNGASATARVVWSAADCKPSQWLSALGAAGYAAVPAGDLLDAAPRVRAQRLLLWQWLVAGFGLMQAMMYSVPLYVAAPGDITPDAERLLRWGAWMMTLPVLLFSCHPFFAGAWRDLSQRRIGMDVPVALGLSIAFIASTAATFDPAGPWGGEVWYDSVTMFVFFLLSGRLLEQRLRDRTAGALEALVRALPASIDRLGSAGEWQRVPVHRLAVGDCIRVRAGEAFPADGRIEAGESHVDEALLTGESEPLLRRAGDAVIAGSHNLTATLTLRVERLGADTRYAALVALMDSARLHKPQLARLADRIAGPFLWGVLAAAAVAAFVAWPTGPAHALSVVVAVLIVTCPCALSLATPAATLAAAGALARRGVWVSQLQALETLARVDTVVFDKTGTLTQDGLALAAIRCRHGVTADEALTAAAAIASQSLHPVSRSLVAAAGSRLAGAWAREVAEIPGQGLKARVVEGTFAGRDLRLGSARFCGVRAQAAATSQSSQTSGGSQVHLTDATGWIATFDLCESLRPDAIATLTHLRALGLDVRLLSGDRPQAVARLAQRAGIAVWEGGCSPQDKQARVRALQAQGRRVLMVGDGMNDGPVLACADVSVAMGEGVPLARAHSDAVIQGSRLAAVATLITQSRRTRRVVWQNLLWAAVYNAACVPLAVAGLMPPWLAGLGMATSSLLGVLNAARLATMPRTV
jgi:Cu2+-exporting ATPase